MKFLEVNGLTIRRGGAKILDGVSFTLDEDERLGLVGKSGSGKSILLQTLKGVEEYRPDAGKVLYHVAACKNPECRRVNPPSHKGPCPRCGSEIEPKTIDLWGGEARPYQDALKGRIAILLQKISVSDQRSSLENVIATLEAVKYPKEERIKRAQEVLCSVGLCHRLTLTAKDLSGGEKGRVALARQVATDPLFLLLDEPTGTSDSKVMTTKISGYLEQIQKLGRLPMMATSHIPSFLTQLAPRSLLLEDGRVVDDGKTERILESFLSRGRGVGKVVKAPRGVGEVLLKCRDLKKYYYSPDRGYTKVLDGVTLSVGEREIHGVIGGSGSGKTTLANILSAQPIEKGFKGECSFRLNGDWVDMGKAGPKDRGRARQHIALAFQEYGLFSNKTVYENLRGVIPEFSDKEARERILSVLGRLGLGAGRAERLLERMPDEVSEGETRLITLALSIIKKPLLLILDEPTGTLDPVSGLEVAEGVRWIRDEEGVTVLAVSHDLDLVKNLCDSVTVIRGGKSIFTGSAEEALKIGLGEEKEGSL